MMTMRDLQGLKVACAALAALASAGCHDENANESRLAESRGAWRAMIAAQGETYSYEQGSESWTGYRTHSAVQFEDGAATYRRFESSPGFVDGMLVPLELKWEERGGEIGTHVEAGPIASVDQMYDQCARDVLTRDPGRNMIELAFDERDLLQVCSYWQDGCADDCWMGVGISNLQMGKSY